MAASWHSTFQLLRLYSLRQWIRRPGRTLLSLAGLVLGVALVAAVSVLSASIERSYTALLSDLAGRARLQVTADSPAGFSVKALEVVQQEPGVEVAVPIVRLNALLLADRGEQPVTVYGIDPAEDPRVRLYRLAVGRLPGTTDPAASEVALSEEVARRLGVSLGDRIRLLTVVGARQFTVSGILGLAGVGLANAGNFAVIPLKTAQALYLKGDRIDQIDIVPGRLQAGEKLAEAIVTRLEAAGYRGVQVGTPVQRGREANQMLEGVRASLWIAAVIGGIVGSFMVFINLRRSVRERRPELGVLRALGAEKPRIHGLLMAEAVALGTVGTAAGSALGMGMAKALATTLTSTVLSVYQFNATRTPLTPTGLVMAVLAGIGGALLAAHAAARELGGLQPADSVRPTARDLDREPGAPGARLDRLRVARGAVLTIAGLGVAAGLAWRGPSMRSHTALVWFNVLAFGLAAAGLATILPDVLAALARWSANRAGPRYRGFASLLFSQIVRERQRWAATAAGLTLSVGFLVAIHAYATSFKVGVASWAAHVMRWDLLVTSSWAGTGSKVQLPATLGAQLETVPGVQLASPERFALVRTIRADGRRGPMVWWNAFDWNRAEAFTYLDVVEGLPPRALYERLHRGEGVAISRLAANYTGLGIGDRLVVATAEGPTAFELLAIVNDVSPDLGVVYADRTLYERYWHDSTADAFAVVLAPGVSPQSTAEEIRRRWGELFHLQVFEADTFRRKMLGMVDESFALTMGLVLVGLLVGAFSIGNGIVLGIEERRRQLAILRAVGADAGQVGRLIAAEGVFVGLVAVGLGVVLGLIGSVGLVRGGTGVTGTRMPFVLPAQLAGQVALMAGVLVPAVCWVGSRAAARLPVAESLRYE